MTLYLQVISFERANVGVETFTIVVDGCDSLRYCQSRGLGTLLVQITIVKTELVTTEQAFDDKIRGTDLSK